MGAILGGRDNDWMLTNTGNARRCNSLGVAPLRAQWPWHFPILDLTSVSVKASDSNHPPTWFVKLCVSITVLLLGACHRPVSESKPAVDGAVIYASACARCHGAD